MFCKIIETPRGRQILAKIGQDADDCAPEIRFTIEGEDLFMAEIAIGFSDDDKGWEDATKALIAFPDPKTDIVNLLENLIINTAEKDRL